MKIFFLSGLPRAGNTLLGSLLTQNPDIGGGVNGICMEAMKMIYLLKQHDVFLNYPNEKPLDNILDAIYPCYYKDFNCKYIIDRTPAGTDGNLMLLKKHLQQPIKIIVLMRPLLEVLASFIKWGQKEPKGYINKHGDVVQQCHWLMRPEGNIVKEIQSFENLMKPENKHYALFIQFKDLVKKPKPTLKQIYKFLDIPSYTHRFKQLDQLPYDDRSLGGGLHTIHTGKIKEHKTSVKKLLPPEIIQAYGHLKWKVIN
tara:strand:- start:4403 stop:5170 length:768 start_codon:yes stop_codon:yes gene_type:complete